jgi:hypothetical protein
MADSGNTSYWSCVGSNGGSTAQCSSQINSSTNAQCGPALNVCISGMFQDVSDTTGYANWSCLGTGGGSNSSCAILLQHQTYNWVTNNWTVCAGGIQTRTTACKRGDGVTVDDNNCSGNRPITYQTCSMIITSPSAAHCSGSVQCITYDGGDSCTTNSCPVGCRAELADVTDNYSNITHVNGGRALRGTNCDAGKETLKARCVN